MAIQERIDGAVSNIVIKHPVLGGVQVIAAQMPIGQYASVELGSKTVKINSAINWTDRGLEAIVQHEMLHLLAGRHSKGI